MKSPVIFYHDKRIDDMNEEELRVALKNMAVELYYTEERLTKVRNSFTFRNIK